MKKTFLHIIILFFTHSVLAQEYEWTDANFIKPGDVPSIVCRMDVSNTAEKVVLGYFSSAISTGSEILNSDALLAVFLAKYDASDSLLWVKTIAETENIIANIPVLEVDDYGNIYVGLSYFDTLMIDSTPHIANEVNPTYSNFVVIKYNSSGDLLNTISLEGSCLKFLALQVGFTVDTQENIFILGTYGNDTWATTDSCTCIFGNDTIVTIDSNVFLAKFDSSFQFVWVRNFGDSQYITASAIQLQGDYLYIAGTSVNAEEIEFGSSILSFPSNYDYAGYIAKYDTVGNFHWAKHFGVEAWDSHVQVFDVQALNKNNIILIGKSFTQSVPNRVLFQNASTLNGYEGGTDDFFIVNYDRVM